VKRKNLKKKKKKAAHFGQDSLSLKSYEAKAQHANFLLLLSLKEMHAK